MSRTEQLKTFLLPLATLTNTIMGVGIFALPYVAARAGFAVMCAYFLALGIIVIVIHLFFSEIALQTPDHKRLPGFVEFYFGGFAKNLCFAVTIVSMICALIMFMAVGGQFLL